MGWGENVMPDRWDNSKRDRFERMFRDEYGAVLAYAVMRADLDVAKDAAAQTFLVAWRRLDEIPIPPRAWLIGVATRTLADSRRSQRRQDALRSRLSVVESVTAAEVERPELATDREVVVAALDQLRVDDSELLRLVYWDDLSCRQAAESLGCSVTALKVRLVRARRRFQIAIEQLEGARSNGGARGNAPKASVPCVAVPVSEEAP